MRLQVSRILHAGYIFSAGGTAIIFDPILENAFSTNCHGFPEVSFDQKEIGKQRLDAIFISHFHEDHFSLQSLSFLDRSTPVYLYTVHPELLQLICELGFSHVYALKIGELVTVGAFEVMPTRALDKETDCIFQIKTGGLRVLNIVDAEIDSNTLLDLAKSAPWDLVLWPFQTLREVECLAPSRCVSSDGKLPAHWRGQMAALCPSAIVPSSCQFRLESWSWYNRALFPITYANFRRQIKDWLPESQVIELAPGESICLPDGERGRLSWVQLLEPRDADFVYDPHLHPPGTSEIAGHFAAATPEQKIRIHNFCMREIPRLYTPSEDAYFKRSVLWRLSLYDRDGDRQDYHYQIDDESVMVVAEDLPTWVTEIPLIKLFSAVVAGESLTSLYVRINDFVFAPEIEKRLRDADPLADPLVRCLANGAVGSSQRAEMQRLKQGEGLAGR